MVNIHYDVIDDEILEVARMISKRQKTDVKIISLTEIVEVRYEEASEGKTQESKGKEEQEKVCSEGEQTSD